MGAAGGSAAESGGGAGAMAVEAKCGANDTPEKGLQGDVNPGTVNCGLTLLSQVPGGGSVQGSGHCAYVRTGGMIKAYSLADPLKPVETDQEPTVGGSESMRAHTVEGRAVLVSGGGVYDISNCEDLVKKGEISVAECECAGRPRRRGVELPRDLDQPRRQARVLRAGIRRRQHREPGAARYLDR